MILSLRAYFIVSLFFFNDTATTEIYTLSLHDALPISTDRLAATWYNPLSFSIDLNFNDGLEDQVAEYYPHWDVGGGLLHTLNILDGSTNAVMDSRNATVFQNGQYLVWKVSGHVILRVT